MVGNVPGVQSGERCMDFVLTLGKQILQIPLYGNKPFLFIKNNASYNLASIA